MEEPEIKKYKTSTFTPPLPKRWKFKLVLEPYKPPVCMQYSVIRETFYFETNKDILLKAMKIIKKKCRQNLICEYQSLDEDRDDSDSEFNVLRFKVWLKSCHFDVAKGDKTLDSTANTALLFYYHQIYKWSLSLAPKEQLLEQESRASSKCDLESRASSRCEGCINNDLGQNAHMYEGGCLWVEGSPLNLS